MINNCSTLSLYFEQDLVKITNYKGIPYTLKMSSKFLQLNF